MQLDLSKSKNVAALAIAAIVPIRFSGWHSALTSNYFILTQKQIMRE